MISHGSWQELLGKTVRIIWEQNPLNKANLYFHINLKGQDKPQLT